jgi:hypothetical protein
MSNSLQTLSFNREIAEKFKSADVAVVYNHVLFWLRQNEMKGLNQIDGKTWMYEKAKDMSEFFGYMETRTVERCLEKLVEAGFLIKDCKNKNKFDRTSWYALPDNSKNLCEESNNSKNLFEASKLTVQNRQNCRLYNKEEQEEEHQLLCSFSPVGEKSLKKFDFLCKDYKGNEVNISIKDMTRIALKLNKGWSGEEIAASFEIMSTYDKISDPIELMEGIIKKMRIRSYNDRECKKIKASKKRECPIPKSQEKLVTFKDLNIEL